VELQQDIAELDSRGIKLVTISYDSPEVLAAFTENQGITFTMLSDPDSSMIERFDLLNPVPEWAVGEDAETEEVQQAAFTYVSVVNPNERMVGIAFPGTLILDTDGVVVERYFEDFYIERNTISSVLLDLGNDLDPVEATEVSMPQLDLTTFPSNPALAPGNRFRIVLEIEPGTDMHIYAPGASDDYTSIRLEMAPHPWVRLLPMELPESGEYYFEPLDDTQPVYEEPFTLLQEAILEGSLEAQAALRGQESITLEGTLHFQACDASICYIPSAVPLAWTMDLRPLVFGR
jgi:peroxiredoxin